MPRRNPHLHICTPTHSGQVCVEYVKSLIETLPALAQSGIGYTHSFIIGDALVHDARNRLVAWFMANEEATDMLFVDADIWWDPWDAVKLAKAPQEVIGGAYPQKRDDLELYNVSGLRPTSTELIEVDYLGAGFLKIKRSAIRTLIEKHKDLRYQGGDESDCYGLFDAPIADGKLTGEDAMFCRRWRDAGGKVFMYPNMEFGHVGQKMWRGNFAEWANRKAQERQIAANKQEQAA